MLAAKHRVIRVLVQTPTFWMDDPLMRYPISRGVCTKSLATTYLAVTNHYKRGIPKSIPTLIVISVFFWSSVFVLFSLVDLENEYVSL